MVSSLVEIAARHRTRADLYAAIGRLLRHPPGQDELSTLRAVLARHEADPAGSEAARPLALMRALAVAPNLPAARKEYRARLMAGPVDLACEPSYSAVPDAAYAAVGLPPSADKVRELEVLAALNQRASEAALHGDAQESRRLGSLERRYLSAHAGLCLDTLAGQLTKADGFYGKLGLALEALLEDEIHPASP
ncbi:MAG TPA: hypothetical protein VND93_26815 [Myxococcales bacterium]|nr:hypothetical protein [Myxococcales bacterium]